MRSRSSSKKPPPNTSHMTLSLSNQMSITNPTFMPSESTTFISESLEKVKSASSRIPGSRVFFKVALSTFRYTLSEIESTSSSLITGSISGRAPMDSRNSSILPPPKTTYFRLSMFSPQPKIQSFTSPTFCPLESITSLFLISLYFNSQHCIVPYLVSSSQ